MTNDTIKYSCHPHPLPTVFCRYAPSLGDLEGTPESAWLTPPYDRRKHRREACVFFGLYDLRDYIALWRHRGPAWVLWAGSDIKNLDNGFLLNDGKLKWLSKIFKGWFKRSLVWMLNNKAAHWTENKIEADCLTKNNIRVTGICPSYMGDVATHRPLYRHKSKLRVYACAPEGREKEYGWDIIEKLAGHNKKIHYYLFGSDSWQTRRNNIHVVGRIPKEKMNEMIREMQVGLRLNEFDGFSEILAKGILMGHHVISRIPYEGLPSFRDQKELHDLLDEIQRRGQLGPDVEIRKSYLKKLNAFPWNLKQ